MRRWLHWLMARLRPTRTYMELEPYGPSIPWDVLLERQTERVPRPQGQPLPSAARTPVRLGSLIDPIGGAGGNRPGKNLAFAQKSLEQVNRLPVRLHAVADAR